MAIRTDITIDWDTNPRTITVDAPATELSMQDLYDTMVYREALPKNMDNTIIIKGSGKVVLDEQGNKVGLTVQVVDATVGFEARSGPDWIDCDLNGGNLSGLLADETTVTVNTTHNNPYINITKTLSVSATQQESKSLQFSSYNGGVMIDTANLTNRAKIGTTHPAGTAEQPNINLSDLHVVSLNTSLGKIYVTGNLVVNAVANWNRHEFVGESPLKTVITLEDAASVVNCEFYDATISGYLDGNSHIERCVIHDLNYVDGYVYITALSGTITLGTATIARFYACFSTVPGQGAPTTNMNGTGRVSLRDYKGSMLFTNYNGNEAHTIGGTEGNFILDNTITSGTFVFRGTGYVLDTLGNKIPSGIWNGGVTIINERVDPSGSGSTVWTEAEKEEVLAYSKKASDNAEQTNNKL